MSFGYTVDGNFFGDFRPELVAKWAKTIHGPEEGWDAVPLDEINANWE